MLRVNSEISRLHISPVEEGIMPNDNIADSSREIAEKADILVENEQQLQFQINFSNSALRTTYCMNYGQRSPVWLPDLT